MPNTSKEHHQNYIDLIKNFLSEKNCKIYSEFSEEGLFITGININEIYWKTSAASGNAIWKVSHSGGASNEDKDSNANDSGNLTSPTNGADKINYKSYIPTFTGIGAGDIIGFRIDSIGSESMIGLVISSSETRGHAGTQQEILFDEIAEIKKTDGSAGKTIVLISIPIILFIVFVRSLNFGPDLSGLDDL